MKRQVTGETAAACDAELQRDVLEEIRWDPSIDDAQITVTAPEVRGPVSTNAEGFFTLNDLPVAQEVTVQVSGLPSFEEVVTAVRLDYRQPVNRVTFALSPT